VRGQINVPETEHDAACGENIRGNIEEMKPVLRPLSLLMAEMEQRREPKLKKANWV